MTYDGKPARVIRAAYLEGAAHSLPPSARLLRAFFSALKYVNAHEWDFFFNLLGMSTSFFFAEAAAAPASPRILIENADSVALLGRLNEEIFTLFLGSLAILSRNQDYPWLKTEVGLGWLVFS